MILPTHANAGRPQLYQQRLEVGRALLEVHFANVDEVLPHYADDIEYHDPIVDIYGIQDMTGFLYQLLGAGDLLTVIEDETLVDGTLQSYYSRDYYTEGDIMTGVPELEEAVLGFRVYYRCAVDLTFDCPL